MFLLLLIILLFPVPVLVSFALSSRIQSVFRATLEFSGRLSGIPHAQFLSNKLEEYNINNVYYIFYFPLHLCA
jgi:hypothetical protein